MKLNINVLYVYHIGFHSLFSRENYYINIEF